MIKYTKCPGCKTDQTIKSSAANRGDLQMKKGTSFKFNCQRCGKMVSVHVNDVKAKVDKRVILVSIVIALVVGVILLIFLGALWLFMLLLPMVFWAQQEQAVSAFNRYKIKR